MGEDWLREDRLREDRLGEDRLGKEWLGEDWLGEDRLRETRLRASVPWLKAAGRPGDDIRTGRPSSRHWPTGAARGPSGQRYLVRTGQQRSRRRSPQPPRPAAVLSWWSLTPATCHEWTPL